MHTPSTQESEAPKKNTDSHCPFGVRKPENSSQNQTQQQVHSETSSDRASLFAGDSMGETYLSPAVLRLAKEYGLPLHALLEIPGGGEDGRITKRDVEEFIKRKEKKRLNLQFQKPH